MQCVVSWACMWACMTGNMQKIDIYKDSNNRCLENIAVVASCIVLGRDELIVSSWLIQWVGGYGHGPMHEALPHLVLLHADG